MADNFETGSASGGAVFASDDIAGVHHQRIKIQYGIDGSATDVSGTNPLPVTVDNLDTSALALETGGNLALIAGAISGSEMQVDVASSALPSGASTAANQTTIIGHLDGVEGLLTTIDDDTGTLVTVVKTEDAAHTSGHAGIMSLGVRRDADTSLVDQDGDYAPFQISASGAIKVEIFDGGDSHTIDGTIAATQSGTWNINNVSGTVSLPTDAATETKQDTIIGLLTTIDGDTGTLAGAVSGTEMQVDVVAALPAGTNNIGDVDILSIAAGSNLIGDVGLSGARTSGGTTIFRSLDLDETEEEVKGTAGQVYWIHAMNLSNGKRYLKFYNATAANVTVGTTTPVLTFTLPTQGDTNGAGFTLAIPNGIAFGTAITVAATTGFADNDTGAPGANEVIVNLGYA